MADLIDRQKIKARFEPWLKVKGYSEGELNILKAVLYEITVMPSVDTDLSGFSDRLWKSSYERGKAEAVRWIPCSERLPEESGRYLISVLDGVGRRTTVAPYQPRYKAWTMTGRMAYWKVIAWMPLPAPYDPLHGAMNPPEDDITDGKGEAK